LLSFFLPPERFGTVGREAVLRAIQPEDWNPRGSPELPWCESIHPKFNEKEELRRIQRRYDVCSEGLRYTLPDLNADEHFRSVVGTLGSEGWKDWHILASVLNSVAGYRVGRRLGRDVSSQKWGEAFRDEIFSPDARSKPQVPASELTLEGLKGGMLANMASMLAGLGLHLHARTPNIEGLKRYMQVRWRYFDLDVPHENLLAKSISTDARG
jgi:hypothetical protein